MSGRRPSRRAVLAASVLALAAAGAAEAGAIWRLSHERETPARAADRAAAASPTPSPTPDYVAAARTKVAAYVKMVGKGHVTVSVRDRETDVALCVGNTRFQTASIVKVDILAALLLHARQSKQAISNRDRRSARTMITESDNAAATALYRRIGGKSGLIAVNRTLGLKETTPNTSWGMTTTTAADQIRLLTTLADEEGPLDHEDRTYLFGLMGEVEEAQGWGVPAAATSETTGVYVKNGWDTVANDDGLWQVNSIGRLVEPGHDWLVAVLSNHHKTQTAGVRMVEAVAKRTLGQLRELPTTTS